MLIFLPMMLVGATDLNAPEIQLEPTLLSSFSLTQPTETQEDSGEILDRWGQEGSWGWGVHGGYARDMKHHENELALLGIEFDYFIEDNLSLDIGLNILDVTQAGDNTDGLNFTLQLRWHAIAKENWSFFLEGGVGMLWTEDNVPSDGSDFNFTPQVGLGFSFDAGNQARWLLGFRWHHISNANTHRTNPGRDSIMIWAGITFPF